MSLDPLIKDLRGIIAQARSHVVRSINALQVVSNFLIGKRIVEHEQKGEKRASYGAELLNELSASLSEEFGKGFSVTNLKLMRQFFLSWSPRIGQTVSDQSLTIQTLSGKLPSLKNQTVSGEFVTPSLESIHINPQISQTLSTKFPLGWSLYLPSKEELRQQLQQAQAEWEEGV